MKRILMALLVTGAVVAPSTGLVFADLPPPVDPVQETVNPSFGGGEIALQTVIGGVIDDLNGGGSASVQNDQALRSLVFGCPVGTCPGTIIIEQAGNAPANAMGIYDLSDAGANPDRVVLFDGSKVAGNTQSFLFDGDGSVVLDNNNDGIKNAGDVDTNVFFGSGTNFGVFIETEPGAVIPGGIFFSQDSRNIDLRRHVLFYHTETGGVSSNGIPILDHSYLFAFEDLPQGSSFEDFDYNDFVYNFRFQTNIPPPPNVPEPGTMVLFGLGSLGAAFVRRRKSQA